METNQFDVLKMQLVEYFKQIEKYQSHKRKWTWKKNKDQSVYLINVFNKSFQIIKIVDHSNRTAPWSAQDLKENQNEISGFKKEVITTNHSKLKVLTLVLTKEVSEPLLFNNDDSIIFVNLATVVAQLKPIYPQINQIETIEFKESSFDDEEDFKPENLTSVDLEQDSSFVKRVKNFQVLTTRKNPILTYILVALPILIPFIAVFLINELRIIMQANGNAFNMHGGPNIESQLFLGGSYKHLIFAANQYWRWLVYPFAGGGFLILLLSGAVIFICGRIVETFYSTWKLLLIILVSTILLGIVHSIILPATYTRGAVYVPNILAGPALWAFMIMAPASIYAFSRNNLAAYLTRRRLIIPAIVLVLIALEKIETMTLPYILAFLISFFVSYFIGYKKQVLDWKRWVALGLITALIIMVIVLYFTSNQLVINDNPALKDTLESYVRAKFINQQTVDNILGRVRLN